MAEGRTDLAARQQWILETMDRQRAVVEAMRPGADEPEAPRRWLAMERQAATYLRHLEPQRRSPPRPGAPEGTAAALEDHCRDLERLRQEAQAASGVPAGGATERRDLGLRLAVMGKGGAGKTFFAATVARSLAGMGRRVLAVDLDTNPGLALSLGMPRAEGSLPGEALEPHPGSAYGWQLASGLAPGDAVERFAPEGPDGVRFLSLGKIGSVDKEAAKKSVTALLQVLLGFGSPGWDVVADMEAGPTTPFEGYHSFADGIALVVGPAWRSAMTARRLLPMVGPRPAGIAANRYHDEPDHPGLKPVVRIPFDHEVRDAESRGAAPADACPEAPAVATVRRLARQLAREGIPALEEASP